MRQELCPTCPHAADARSVPQHRRLFGLIKAAYTHWPEAHNFEPENPEHLRGWLLCKAGHHTAQDFELPETDDSALMARMMEFAEALLDTKDGTRFGRWRGPTLRVFIPRSIAFDKLSHKAACGLFDEIGAVIEAEIGIKADDLLRETEAAA